MTTRNEPLGELPKDHFTDDDMAARRAKANRHLAILATVGLLMFGFAFANVPLFNMLCEKLGISQNPNNQALADSTEISDRQVEVTFLSNVMGALPVTFSADKSLQRVRLGEQTINDYTFVNLTDRPNLFRPVHSVKPTDAASDKFHLAQCFCFDDQMLHPRQRVTLPVVYKISPDLNPDVRRVTLLYTLFEITEPQYRESMARKKAEGTAPKSETANPPLPEVLAP